MYAGDLQIYMPSSAICLPDAIHLINEDLARISCWASSNSLCVNPAKSQAILYSRSDIDLSHLHVIVGGEIVEWCSEVKNLGLCMDSKLSFDTHINNICQRSYFKLKSIYEYRNTPPCKIKEILTESLILSIPNYLDIVYGPFLTNYNKYRIQKIQNSCVRFVQGLSRGDHVSQHIVRVYQCNMAQRRYVHLSCLIYKAITFNEPLYLTELIVVRRDIHQANTRFRDALSIPRHRTEFFKSCFLYLSAVVYNSLPRNFKLLSMPTFKFRIKKFVCDNLLFL